MSTHMLSDEEFQQIADWIYSKAIYGPSHYCCACKDFLGLERGSEDYYSLDHQKAQELTGYAVRNLYNLNRLAQVTRYGEKYDPNDETQWIPKITDRGTVEMFIQTLQSLRYQCAEYLTADTKLFESLTKFIGDLCTAHFTKTQEEKNNDKR